MAGHDSSIAGVGGVGKKRSLVFRRLPLASNSTNPYTGQNKVRLLLAEQFQRVEARIPTRHANWKRNWRKRLNQRHNQLYAVVRFSIQFGL